MTEINYAARAAENRQRFIDIFKSWIDVPRATGLSNA